MHAPLTPTQRDFMEARKARLERFNNAACIQKSKPNEELLIAKQQFEEAWGLIHQAHQMIEKATVNLRMSEDTHDTLSMRNILRVVAAYYCVSVSEIVSDRRAGSIILPRHVSMYLAKTLTAMSFPEIGRRIGGRDHTTVLHGYRKILRELETDTALKAEISDLTAKLQCVESL